MATSSKAQVFKNLYTAVTQPKTPTAVVTKPVVQPPKPPAPTQPVLTKPVVQPVKPTVPSQPIINHVVNQVHSLVNTSKPATPVPTQKVVSPKPMPTYQTVLDDQEERFWNQANTILKLGGKLTPQQQKTYSQITNKLKVAGVKNPTQGLKITTTPPKSVSAEVLAKLDPQSARFITQADTIKTLGGQLNPNQAKTFSSLLAKANQLGTLPKYTVNPNTDWNKVVQANQAIVNAKKILETSNDPKAKAQALKTIQDTRTALIKAGIAPEYIVQPGDTYQTALKKFADLQARAQGASMAYSPVNIDEVVAPIGADLNELNPYYGLDLNKVLELNNQILKASANYYADPNGTKQKVNALRQQLKQMGVPDDLILPNVDMKSLNAAYQSLVNKIGDIAKLPNTSYSQYTAEQIQKLMDAMNDPNSDFWKQYRDQAEQEAEQQFQEQQQALNELIASLTAQQDNELKGVDASVEEAKQALEDQIFQQWLQARQAMADRGLAGSGLASDQDTRLLMARQQNLAKILNDAELKKAQIMQEYGQKLQEARDKLSKLSKEQLANDLFQKYYEAGRKSLQDQVQSYSDMLKNMLGYDMPTAGQKLDYNINSGKLQLDQQKAAFDQTMKQREQALKAIENDRRYSLDLSKATGYLYGANGKPITDKNGHLIPILDKQKLDEAIRHNKATETETQRHNKVTEGLESQRIAETKRHNMANENLGQQRVDLEAKKLVAQINQWAEENRLKAQKQDLDAKKFMADQKYKQALLDQAGAKLADSKTREQLGVYKQQLNQIYNLMKPYAQKGKKVPKNLVDKYNAILEKVAGLLNDADFVDFNGIGEGGDGKYNNFWKTWSDAAKSPTFKQFNSILMTAIKKAGVPESWAPYVMELVGRESAWNPKAKNPKSTAYGYGQFLKSTKAEYERKYGIKYSSPLNQLILTLHYIKDRYGNPVNALRFWDEHNWY
jgi:hypothetical protein